MTSMPILLDKEKKINELLKKINSDYEIALLRKTAKGRYQFALTADFDPGDLNEVRKVFRSVLRGLKGDRKKVQSKVYLQESVHRELRRLAFEDNRSLSDIVEEGIRAYSRQRQA